MKSKAKYFTVPALAGFALVFAPSASAHTLGSHGAGFAAGVAHPFIGLDHLLTMLAVGLWAAQLGGAALWRVPAAFVAAMAVGAALARPELDLAGLELAVGGSVLALGLLLAFALRLPGLLAPLAVALLALSHGAAHGLEMPQTASPWGYGLGFLLATAGLHGAGIALGLSLKRSALARVGGVAIAAAGLWLLAV
ncbi:MAG: HupE/UreJ family protein [Candidatus Methylumidiphilus sp.]